MQSYDEYRRMCHQIEQSLEGLTVRDVDAYINDENGRIGIAELVLEDPVGRLISLREDPENRLDIRIYARGKDEPETWDSWEKEREDAEKLQPIDEVLTVRQVARILKFTERRVRDFIADGRIPAVKVGRAWRIKRSEVDRIADEGL